MTSFPPGPGRPAILAVLALLGSSVAWAAADDLRSWFESTTSELYEGPGK